MAFVSSRLARGVVPLLVFALLTAALDVFAGNQFTRHSPISVAAISFTLAGVFFVTMDVVRRGPRAVMRPMRVHRYDVVMINVTTAVTWLSMLYALKFLEPAIVNVVGLALGPMLTIVLSPLLRPGTSVLRGEVAVSAGICVCIAVLVWGSMTGHSGLDDISTTDALIGAGLTLLTGVGSVSNVIYSKRLSEAGYTPPQVLAVRFFLMIVVGWAMVAGFESDPGLAGAFLPSAVIAVVGVGVPLYVLQVGIKHTEPITASIVLTASPIFAFGLQLFDTRLDVAPLTLIGVVGITALVVVSILVRNRADAAAEAAANPDTVPATESN